MKTRKNRRDLKEKWEKKSWARLAIQGNGILMGNLKSVERTPRSEKPTLIFRNESATGKIQTNKRRDVPRN